MVVIRNSRIDHADSYVRHESSLEGDYVFRVVSLSDSGKTERNAWIKRIFDIRQYFEYRESDTFAFSTAQQDFDVILISGVDAARIKQIMKAFAPILNSKACVCITQGAGAKFRAEVLSAGMDDVLDIHKISPPEAIARLNATNRRYKQNFVRHAFERQVNSILRRDISFRNLSEREVELMRILLDAKNKAVSYYFLREILSHDHMPISEKHLHVIISGLRKKLNTGVTIKAVTGVGYRLSIARNSVAEDMAGGVSAVAAGLALAPLLGLVSSALEAVL